MGGQETIDGIMSAVAERDVKILELNGIIDAIKDIVNEFVPGVSASSLLGRIKDMIDPVVDEVSDDEDDDFYQPGDDPHDQGYA